MYRNMILGIGTLAASLLCTASAPAQVGSPFCFGDGSDFVSCPCANVPAVGSGEHCTHSTGVGAFLTGTGSPIIGADSLSLTINQGEPNEAAIFISNSGNAGIGGGFPFNIYDGAICVTVDAALTRHFTDPSTGMSIPTILDGTGTGTNVMPLSQSDFNGLTAPGATIYYQAWFRSPSGPCGLGANFSSGLSVTWTAGGSNMVQIPAGTFEMGDHAGVGASNELPAHTVTLDSFWMDVYEVTNQKYADYLNSAYGQGLIQVVGGVVFPAGNTSYPYCDTDSASFYSRIVWNGSTFTVEAGKADHPMVEVSWYGAAAYANWRSSQDGLVPCYNLSTWDCNFAASGYRLPTEAEWEYAARGGEHSPYYRYPWGNTIDGSQANYESSGDPYETGSGLGIPPLTTPVGYYDGNQIPSGVDMANGYGLYDMAGNVWEWCGDWYDGSYYSVSSQLNPHGPTSSPFSRRVTRGCSWDYSADLLRSAQRGRLTPDFRDRDVGFRLARVSTD